MGYSYKNLKVTPIDKNKPKYKEIRKIYAKFLTPIFNHGCLFVYVDELACSLSNFIKKKGGSGEIKKIEGLRDEEEYVSVLIAASAEGVLYYQVKSGFMNRYDFCDALKFSVGEIERTNHESYLGPQRKYFFITDVNKIHRDQE